MLCISLVVETLYEATNLFLNCFNSILSSCLHIFMLHMSSRKWATSSCTCPQKMGDLRKMGDCSEQETDEVRQTVRAFPTSPLRSSSTGREMSLCQERCSSNCPQQRRGSNIVTTLTTTLTIRKTIATNSRSGPSVTLCIRTTTRQGTYDLLFASGLSI